MNPAFVLIPTLFLAAAAEEAPLHEKGLEEGGLANPGARPEASTKGNAPALPPMARGLDARIRQLADAVAADIKRMPGDHRDQVVAVLDFKAATTSVNPGANPTANLQDLGVVVGDLITGRLLTDHRLNLVERSRLGAVLDELALDQSGFVNPEQAKAVGQLLSARALVTGTLTAVGDSIRVQTRVVDGQSGQIFGASQALLPMADLEVYARDAVVLKSRAGAFFRSLVAPGWGQTYNGEPLKGALLGGAVILSALTAGGMVAMALSSQEAYRRVGTESNPTNPAALSQQALDMRQAADTQLTLAAVFAGLGAGLWGGTAVEALVSGRDAEELDALRGSR
jgi:hypothetical protein